MKKMLTPEEAFRKIESWIECVSWTENVGINQIEEALEVLRDFTKPDGYRG